MVLGQELKYLNDLQLLSRTGLMNCQSHTEEKLIYKKTHPASDAISITPDSQQGERRVSSLQTEIKP